MSNLKEIYDLDFGIIDGPLGERNFEMYRAELWLSANKQPSELQIHTDILYMQPEVNMEMLHMVEYVRQNAPLEALESFPCPYMAAELWIHSSSRPAVEMVARSTQSSPQPDSASQMVDMQAEESDDAMCITEINSPPAEQASAEQRFPAVPQYPYNYDGLDMDSMNIDCQSPERMTNLIQPRPNCQRYINANRTEGHMQFYKCPAPTEWPEQRLPDQKEAEVAFSTGKPPSGGQMLDLAADADRGLPGFRTILQCGNSTVYAGHEIPSALGTPGEASRIKELYRNSDAFLFQYPAQSPAPSDLAESRNHASATAASSKPVFDFFYDAEVKEGEAFGQAAPAARISASNCVSSDNAGHFTTRERQPRGGAAIEYRTDTASSLSCLTSSLFHVESQLTDGVQHQQQPVLRTCSSHNLPAGVSSVSNRSTGNNTATTGDHHHVRTKSVAAATTGDGGAETKPTTEAVSSSNGSIVYELFNKEQEPTAEATSSAWSATDRIFNAYSPTRRFIEMLSDLSPRRGRQQQRREMK